MIPKALIEACYRQLLGREPEDDHVLHAKMALPTYDALLNDFLNAPEYVRRFPPHLRSAYLAAPPKVEIDASTAQLQAMFQRIRAEWSRLGDEDPYWSVLTDTAFRADRIEQDKLAAFFETGADSAAAVDAFAQRSGVSVRKGRCIEFGCGVGRVTGHLARMFREVIAVDISPRNLDLCSQAMRDQGVDNVTPLLLSGPDEVELIPAADFLFSIIVLQHNPPPIQHYLLDVLLSKVLEGGGFLFQIPTATPGYAFSINEYLASPAEGMELHDLPMTEVFKLLATHRATPLEVTLDGWTGLSGSHTFFGLK